MESNLNNSRVGIQIGEPTEGNEKTSITLEVNFGESSANDQKKEVELLTDEADVNLAVVIVLTAVDNKQQELVELLSQTFSGAGASHISRDIAQAAEAGLISYKIIPKGSKVIIFIKPGSLIEEAVHENINGILGMGVEDLAATEQATIKLNISSGVDFFDVLESHKRGETTLAAFMRSFKAEITASVPQGSELDKKILKLISMIHPQAAQSPFFLLQFIKTVDIDVSFRGIDEVPESIRSKLGSDPLLGNFPTLTKQDKELIQFYKNLTSLLESEINVYATLDKVAAARLNANVKGFGTAMTAASW